MTSAWQPSPLVESEFVPSLVTRLHTKPRREIPQPQRPWAHAPIPIRNLIDDAPHPHQILDAGLAALRGNECVGDVVHQSRSAVVIERPLGHTGGQAPKRAETRLAVAALHQALATEPVYGDAFRRSAGIGEPAASHARAQRKWWADTLTTVLDIA